MKRAETVWVERINGDLTITWPDGTATLALDPADALRQIKRAAKKKTGPHDTTYTRVEWSGVEPPK